MNGRIEPLYSICILNQDVKWFPSVDLAGSILLKQRNQPDEYHGYDYWNALQNTFSRVFVEFETLLRNVTIDMFVIFPFTMPLFFSQIRFLFVLME